VQVLDTVLDFEMEVVLDLYNFDSSEAEGSKYVLTSPRSLEACSRLKIKPVELLQKSHAEFSHDNVGKPLELIQVCDVTTQVEVAF